MINYIFATGDPNPLNLKNSERRYYILKEVDKMARQLDPIIIKRRIKVNRDEMKRLKPIITSNMANMMLGNTVDGAKTRMQLSDFIKAAQAFNADVIKLKLTEGK